MELLFLDNNMLKNPDSESINNFGKKWTLEEENTLLQELEEDTNIKIIAQNHKRTVGGIIGKQRAIAYNMYSSKMPIEEIILKTKLDNEQIIETIKRKENKQKKVKKIQEPKNISLENEVILIRSEIKEIKNTLNELVEMMKAAYVFEDV